MGAEGMLLVWLGVASSAVIAMLWWCRRLWQRQHELPQWATLAATGLVALASFAGFRTIVGLIRAFGAIGGESVDPSQKARILAEGISEAMNCTAGGLLFALPAFIAVKLITRKRTPQSDGEAQP